MARKPKTLPQELPAIPQELVDQFVKSPMTTDAVQDAAMAFKKALIERALGAEIAHDWKTAMNQFAIEAKS